MDVFSLVAKLTLDSSEYDNGLNRVKKIAGEFGEKLKTAFKVGGAAIGAATAAVTAFATASVKTGMSFDASMSQVAATMGTTVDKIQDLRDFAQEMGRTTAFSATEAANALNYMALAGYDADTSISMLPNVLNLAAAGSIDLAAASDMITDAQSALGLTLEETSAMVDQMAVASSNTNTSVAQLGDAILTVGGTAQYMAGGIEELTAVLGVLADNGIKGAEGGTHLRNMLLSLASPTKDATAVLRDLDVDIFDAAGNMRSFAEIFPELNAAMDSLTDQERLDAMSTLFNARDIASATALLSTSVDRWDELAAAIGDADGAAERMAATQLDNLAGDITLFKSALESAQVAISDGLTPTLRQFVQYGSAAISTLSDAFKTGGFSGAMSALGTILSDGISIIFSSLPTFIEAGAKLLGALGEGIMSNLPMLIDAAFGIIMMFTEYLSNNTDAVVDGAVSIIMALANGLLNNLPTLLYAIGEIVVQLAAAIIRNLPQILEAGGRIVVALVGGILAYWGAVIEKGGEIVDEISAAIAAKFDEIYQEGAELVNKVGEGIQSVIDAATSWGSDLIQNFINGIKSMWGSLKQIVSNIAQTVKDFLGFSEPEKGPLSNFHTYAPDMMRLFAQGIRDNEKLVTDQIAKSFDFSDLIVRNSPRISVGGSGSAAGKVVNLNIYAQQLGQAEMDYIVATVNRELA